MSDKNIMKQNIKKWQFVGFLFTVGVGTLLHFVYEWSGKMVLVAPFSNVNESTWEHMKLLFYPALLFAVIESFFFKDRRDFWSIKLKGILLGLILIPVIYFLFNGIIGESADWVNIAIFVISVIAMYAYETSKFKEIQEEHISNRKAIMFLVLIMVLFGVFTFYTPSLGIFLDPTTNTYGI